MDIFSHGLWSIVIFKFIKSKVSLLKAAFFGVFPDLFAFTPIFIWLNWARISGNLVLPSHGTEPFPTNGLFIFDLTSVLYNISHSLLISTSIFLLLVLLKRPIIELGAWTIHILLDIPTHSYQFYPTPFLWPISTYKFNGFSWATPWFMILNYSLLLFFFIYLFRKRIVKTLKRFHLF